MKLSVNLISEGRYFRAGEIIPDSEVPAFAHKFAVADTIDANGDIAEQEIPNPAPKPVRKREAAPKQRYVRRRFGFQRMEQQQLKSGEWI